MRLLSKTPTNLQFYSYLPWVEKKYCISSCSIAYFYNTTIKNYTLYTPVSTTSLITVELTPASFRSADRNSRSTETNRFRYIKDTVILREVLTIKTLGWCARWSWVWVVHHYSLAFHGIEIFNFSPFRQHLLFTNFCKYATVKISKNFLIFMEVLICGRYYNKTKKYAIFN